MSSIGVKPPEMMRLLSNGIGLPVLDSRRSAITFGIAASRVALSGHSIQEKTTPSPPHGLSRAASSVRIAGSSMVGGTV